MNVRWQINFRSLLGTGYTVDIYDKDYSGVIVTQLVGAANPITTSEDDGDDIFMPIRTQSGYIRFIVEDSTIVNDIQPLQTIDRPVVLRSGNNIMWVGFLRPEQYNQPWETTPYSIELPLSSIMEAMQGVEMTQNEGYVSFFNLVRTIETYLPISIVITAPEETPVVDVYVQNNNFREFLTVAERAERDTTNIYDCDTIYDAVEAFCKYFGFSLHEYKGNFFCVVYPDDGITYEDISPLGDSHETQYSSHTLANMVICGSNNSCDYSSAYRLIEGTFSTGDDKEGDVFSVDGFFKQFSLQGAYPVALPQYLLFNGNAEIQPYKEGIQQTSWIEEATTQSGGQIIRMRDIPINQVNFSGSGWADYFFVKSQKTKVGSPETALKFNIPKCIYLNANEYAAINISANINAWYRATQSGDFIKKLYCKVNIGNYWLSVTERAGYLPEYSWSTSETSCYLIVKNGSLTMEGAQFTLDYRAEAMMDKISGFAINMPSALAPGYYPVYLELLANAEINDDFGEYSSIGYLISGLEIDVLRGVNSLNEPTPELGKNTIMRNSGGAYSENYTIQCPITNKRGVQYGTGIALTQSKEFVTTKYDMLGIVRRANFLSVSHELLTVLVRQNAMPIEGVTCESNNYGILSQGINWCDDENKIKIVKYFQGIQITFNAPNTNLGVGGTVVSVGASYLTAITANEGYELTTVTVIMGGNDITSQVYINGMIAIPSVTAEVVITAAAEALPYDAEVEYLQGDGVAYINTGIATTYNIRIRAEVEIMSTAAATVGAFGARKSASGQQNCMLWYTDKGWLWRYGTASTYQNNAVKGNYTLDNTSAARTMNISGASSATITQSSSSFVPTTDIYYTIFAVNENGSLLSAKGHDLRVKSFKIYNGTSLVRDYIPVRKNGVGYLYDKVSETLFGNANSSGAFTYGNDKN